jgi:isochorismate synthase
VTSDAVRATTRPFERDDSLEDLAGSSGVLLTSGSTGLAGHGVALRVDIDQTVTVLAGIDHDDGGSGLTPLAVGVIPFIDTPNVELVIPAVVVRDLADGKRWVTTINAGMDAGMDGAESAEFSPSHEIQPGASSWTITNGVPISTYLEAVRMARDAVRAGTLAKAVIARDLIVEADRPFDVAAIARRLALQYGPSYRYLFDGLIGASPELLVSRDGDHVRSHPLAGTVARTGDAALDEVHAARLVESVKNQLEHRVVIDMVHDTLLPWCSYLDEEAEPSVMELANVAHLGTAMHGQLSAPPPSVLELARALSPTPALGGFPTAAAMAFIAGVEGMVRGRYGGSVGWVDARGDGLWAVVIRCAEITGTTARLFAGGGIVAASDPAAELAETQAKLAAMLDALVGGRSSEAAARLVEKRHRR